ncbi:MAG TPA: lactate racemase domain-containing protein [Terriglobia bacterium]|nr:lactate racemase domain-containing protein [Terriglobia bacterium]
MQNQPASSVIGAGAPDRDFSPAELRGIVENALTGIAPGARVLAIVPDKTRDDNTDLLFPFAAEALAGRKVSQFDALVAQGTHAPMTEEEKRVKLGVRDPAAAPGLGSIFDHRWADPEQLVPIGELARDRVREMTGSLIDQAVRLTVNRLLAPGGYDTVLIFGATVPHEVAGFAGGAKYFFPGVAGPELTHLTHWLGALLNIENVIGRIETPSRRLIEAAAEFIPARVISLNSVVSRGRDHRLHTRALFAGDVREAFRRAAMVSQQVHIKYTGRKFQRVVALLDEVYDELWVGGKASYKLGPIMEGGGELIIYAPHLRSVSAVHGSLIERYGYAPVEIVRQLVAQSPDLQANLCVAAHLAHVSFASRRDQYGQLVPRYQITLASGIDEETCRRINLGYMDPLSFRRQDYESDPDTLVVEQAGRDLYLPEPF